METVWIVFESSFNCSGRPGHLMGVFSSKEKAEIAEKGEGHGCVVFPLEVDRTIPVRTFAPDH
jgi:hypothetical protein